MRVAVIGGGAAGFFAAASVAHHHPNAEVVLLEKTKKTLSKVKVSGGGRCNVTHDARHHKQLLANYPRGKAIMKKVLPQFDVEATISWFAARGVELVTEPDGRMFPSTNVSQTIVDTLRQTVSRAGVEVRLSSPVQAMQPGPEGWKLHVGSDMGEQFDSVIVATGGSPKKEGLKWLEDLGHRIEPPVPSLFTFNIADRLLHDLAGVSVPRARVWIEGQKKQAETGPLLVTHWGLSGPAALRLSAFKALELADRQYRFPLKVQWMADMEAHQLAQLPSWKEALRSKKRVWNLNPTDLPQRLWEYVVQCAEVAPDIRWIDLGKKHVNKLIEHLSNQTMEVNGKTTFKEEFVTAGGVSAESILAHSMRSTVCDGLYFAGEVVDIDGVTGGFNFQAAWSTAWVAGKLK